jgi:hypothetical protein
MTCCPQGGWTLTLPGAGRASHRRRPHSAIFFLTGGGAYAHVDPRRTSVASAIEFASTAGLQGVIVEACALQQQLQMVELAHNNGLQASISKGCRTAACLRLHHEAPPCPGDMLESRCAPGDFSSFPVPRCSHTAS